jgi:ABC-type uncharacterized transport system ATPase subunit
MSQQAVYKVLLSTAQLQHMQRLYDSLISIGHGAQVVDTQAGMPVTVKDMRDIIQITLNDPNPNRETLHSFVI